MSLNKNTLAFLELVRAGLWEKEAWLKQYGKVDYEEIYRLAGEQAVVGLVTVGMEHIQDEKAPQEIVLQCIGESLQLEQTNKSMNQFIEKIVGKMREEDIYTLLVKGQGIAQCYERPLWRAPGDVDFFLSEKNFLKARDFFRPLIVGYFDPANESARNISATLPPWDIELHANMDSELSQKIDRGIRGVQDCIFYEGKLRSWINGQTIVFLPDVDSDVIIIFTHFLKHFFKGGLGIRQLCDWCRLLWVYRDKIDLNLLERRLQSMCVMSEWIAFGTLAVDYLGMPLSAMPFYNPSKIYKRKAYRIMIYLMNVGNMGHNRDMSFYGERNRFVRKLKSFRSRVSVLTCHMRIFPLDSLSYFPYMVYKGVKSYLRGE